MKARRAVLLTGLLMLFAGVPWADEGSRLAPFFAMLSRSGRAEVRIERRDAQGGGGAGPLSGRVVLEPPDRVRLEFDRTGERITLRSDGGEWLQPELRQMVRLGAARARDALVWWDLLLGPARDGFEERALGKTRVLLMRRDTALAGDTVIVTLDPGGRPAALRVVVLGGEAETYRLTRWRFVAPRGPADFRLRAPSEYEVTVLH